MSYDIQLVHPQTRETIKFDAPHQLRGGTFAAGGSYEAWLNVTYNYSEHFYRVFGDDGIRTIYGMTGAESLPVLRAAIGKLGDDKTDNYWDSTEGNAKAALRDLLTLAERVPDGIWEGD